MIIDMKYHIVSLVAVFLALGIGILIGTTMVGSEAIINMQKQVTDRLEKNYDLLQKENKQAQVQIGQLAAEVRTSRQFAKEVLPVLVGNRLSGLSVAVIETSNLAGHEELLDTLKTAGVRVTSVTTFLGELGLDNPQKLAETKNVLGIQGETPKDLLGAIAGVIATSVFKGENLDKLQYLQGQNIVKAAGEYGVPVNGVIFVGGSMTGEDMYARIFDEPMIRYFTQANVPVYGVEAVDVPISYMKEYQRMKITTVDNIDTVPGRVALVYAMQNRPGHYGIKETAKNLLPPLL